MRLWHHVWIWLAALSLVTWLTVGNRPADDPEPALPAQAAAARTAAAPNRPMLPPSPDSGPGRAVSLPSSPDRVEKATREPLGEWETFQRDATHTGYVPASFNPDLFTEKWQWQRAEGAITSVATAPGYVVVSDAEDHASPALRVLREVNGAPVWQQTFQNYFALNSPAAANGMVYVTTTGHENTFLWAFAVEDGTPVFQAAFQAQWSHLLAPTVSGMRVFTNGGYYDGSVYAFDATAGDEYWSISSGDDNMSTPAVDETRVFHYDGAALKVYGVETGEELASIFDPYLPDSGYSYHSAPMLGKPDSVTAFSGSAYSGLASSRSEPSETRYLLNFSIDQSRARWRSSRRYVTQPAVAKGVIYAGSNNPKSFDAIDETTGRVLWSWVPDPGDLSFHRNVVVTDNLVFVSTNRALYALDLATRKPVWSYPFPGMLAISGSGTLYIVGSTQGIAARLVAISLTGHWESGGRGPRRRR